MTDPRKVSFGDRKALLSARAELDRAKLTLAFHQVKAIVAPTPAASRVAGLRPATALLIGITAPILGGSRIARWLRVLSLAMAAMRIARHW